MRRVKVFISGLLACIFLVGCSPGAAQPLSTSQPAQEQNVLLTPTPQDHYQVVAWVSNPTPSRDEQVIVFGSLIKNGVYLSGMMMQAAWPDKTHPSGTRSCSVLVLYKRGVCVIDAGKTPVGEFVSVEITFQYQGLNFSGHTGYTPTE